MSQCRLYAIPFNCFLVNNIRFNTSYAHWESVDIKSLCNFGKRKLHPSVIAFYLKESVKALMDVRVFYFDKQYITMFMMAYMEAVKKNMKAKMKMIIVKSDFSDVKYINGIYMVAKPPCSI